MTKNLRPRYEHLSDIDATTFATLDTLKVYATQSGTTAASRSYKWQQLATVTADNQYYQANYDSIGQYRYTLQKRKHKLQQNCVGLATDEICLVPLASRDGGKMLWEQVAF